MDPYWIWLSLVSKEIEIIPDEDSLDFPDQAQLEPSRDRSVSPRFPPLRISLMLAANETAVKDQTFQNSILEKWHKKATAYLKLHKIT